MSSSSSDDLILVLNCGSSSIKFAVFDANVDPLPRTPLWNGKVQGIGGGQPDFGETGVTPFPIELDAEDPYRTALQVIRKQVAARMGRHRIVAVAHRVVHGGSKYFASAVIDDDVLRDLRSYVPLAPLHQPFALEAIGILLRERPDILQVACFDTAFHRSQPDIAQQFALPRSFTAEGIKRYGFHGLSYEYIARALPQHSQRADGRVVVCHLGNGASMAAMVRRKCVATTLGFSTIDGLMMGTRCGNIDPGLILHLMESKQLSVKDMTRILYKESGLLGVSGISQDMRTLLASDKPEAHEAVELFCYRIARELGTLAAAAGGLDAVVFTGGIGEHAAEVRRRVCLQAEWLGIRVNPEANARHDVFISAGNSSVDVLVIPTNEEWMMAHHAQTLLAL